LGQAQVDVSHLELEVLACLAATPGVVWSYERLHEVAWGSRYLGDRDSVYSLVKRLRRKLAEAQVELDLLAVRGVGFQLVPQSQPPVEPTPLSRWEPEAG
jgi:DNA-binding response OmpR family regulator